MVFSATSKALALAAALGASVLAGAARADEPSPEALQLAARLINDVGLTASVTGLTQELLINLERSVVAIHPEMQSALHETLVGLAPDYTKSIAPVLEELAHVVTAHMTVQDLRDATAFFEGPVGRKYLATQPAMLQDLNLAGNAWRQKTQADLLARVRDEMKKKGYEF